MATGQFGVSIRTAKHIAKPHMRPLDQSLSKSLTLPPHKQVDKLTADKYKQDQRLIVAVLSHLKRSYVTLFNCWKTELYLESISK